MVYKYGVIKGPIIRRGTLGRGVRDQALNWAVGGRLEVGAREVGGGNEEDGAGGDVVGVLHMRVVQQNERSMALLADRLQRLPLVPHHVHLLTRRAPAPHTLLPLCQREATPMPPRARTHGNALRPPGASALAQPCSS
ncbi:hypothetical protein GOP47_0025035 [Adiantum capillus-veneris]|uniref:Uncharacterized protein n=1 Tax=Adiantum capillus-veneris TaxID=13818 RepID=A0A9D4U3Y1_ADICA|nr:hypothetical protein GOP47_0025035 [Adiantum capillus-veneris]